MQKITPFLWFDGQQVEDKFGLSWHIVPCVLPRLLAKMPQGS